MKQLILAADRVVGGLILGLACILLALAAACGLYQIIARFILEEPSTWTEVLTRTLIIWSVFLGLAASLRGGALLSVDLMYRTVAKTPFLPVLQAFITGLTLLFLLVIIWFGWDMVHRVRFQTLAGLEISISWAYAAIPVGGICSLLAVVAHYLDPLRGELETQQI